MLETLQHILNQLGIQTDVASFFVFFGLVMSRLVTAISFSPFLGGKAVPTRVKVGLAAILAAVLLPSLVTDWNVHIINASLFVGLLLKELLIGAGIGLISQLIFYAVQMAGTIIDTQRGMNQVTFFSPQLPGNTSVLGQLKFQTALVLFLAMDGHLVFLRALHSSYHEVPLLGFPHLHMGIPGSIDQMIRISADVFLVALQLSAPVLLALFLVDIAFAAFGKVASQVSIHNESQPVKCLVGLAIFFLSVAFVLGKFPDYFARMIREIYDITKMLA